MTKRSTKAKAQKKKLPASDLGEDALEIVARNAPLNEARIKALRLVCKRTKAAATGRVREFKLTDLEQNASRLRASGLLNTVTNLEIELDLRALEDEAEFASKWSCAVDLLHLVTDSCSKSAKRLIIDLQASPEKLVASGCVLGKTSWDSLGALIIAEECPMPGFLSGFLALPGYFPKLKKISCEDATGDDIQALLKSGLAENLTILCAYWSLAAYRSTAPATVAAMRSLLHKASKLEDLCLGNSNLECFDCEELNSLKELTLEYIGLPSGFAATPPLTPVLARPWPQLEILTIKCATLTQPDVVRIFEAQDNFLILGELTLENCQFEVDALLSIHRPRLEKLLLCRCNNGNAFISKMAALIKSGMCTLPELRTFAVDTSEDDNPTLVVTALKDLICCPAMAAIEKLSIQNAELTADEAGLVHIVARHCFKIKELDLSLNELGRSAVALLLGYGIMGVWPNLEKLGILKQFVDDEDPNSMNSGGPNLPKLDVKETLRCAWPNLQIF